MMGHPYQETLKIDPYSALLEIIEIRAVADAPMMTAMAITGDASHCTSTKPNSASQILSRDRADETPAW
jgi:hypothetical protein